MGNERRPLVTHKSSALTREQLTGLIFLSAAESLRVFMGLVLVSQRLSVFTNFIILSERIRW